LGGRQHERRLEAHLSLTIKNDKGDVVWDLESYEKYIGLDKPAPDTVNRKPS
jgi:hypothetical protein